MKDDMFVFDLHPDELDFCDPENASELSKSLYRIQSISLTESGNVDIFFRHHLDPTVRKTTQFREMKDYIRVQSLKNLHGVKVRLDQRGRVVQVGSYL